MRDPVLVEVASLPPGFCFGCGSIDGPLVDTMVDTFDGRVYLCVSKCVATFAGLAGLSDASEVQQRLDDANAAARAMADQLAEQQPLFDAVMEAAANLAMPPEPESTVDDVVVEHGATV
jgi:hypothetical protein